MLPVDNVARDDPKAIIWLIANIDKAMNQSNLWLIYPKSLPDGTNTVTAVASVNQERQSDILEFSACVGNINLDERPGVLPLFIGRNVGRGHHFLNLDIPSGFELPNLQPRRFCRKKKVRV